MKRKILGGLVCGALLVINASTQANDLQKYYDTGAEVIQKFRSCSTLPDQTSVAVTRCLEDSSALISRKSSELKQLHAATLKRQDLAGLDLLDSQNKAGKLKQSCVELYPEALRVHFKNQIRACQIQVDLHRFFYLYDYMVAFG